MSDTIMTFNDLVNKHHGYGLGSGAGELFLPDNTQRQYKIRETITKDDLMLLAQTIQDTDESFDGGTNGLHKNSQFSPNEKHLLVTVNTSPFINIFLDDGDGTWSVVWAPSELPDKEPVDVAWIDDDRFVCVYNGGMDFYKIVSPTQVDRIVPTAEETSNLYSVTANSNGKVVASNSISRLFYWDWNTTTDIITYTSFKIQTQVSRNVQIMENDIVFATFQSYPYYKVYDLSGGTFVEITTTAIDTTYSFYPYQLAVHPSGQYLVLAYPTYYNYGVKTAFRLYRINDDYSLKYIEDVFYKGTNVGALPYQMVWSKDGNFLVTQTLDAYNQSFIFRFADGQLFEIYNEWKKTDYSQKSYAQAISENYIFDAIGGFPYRRLKKRIQKSINLQDTMQIGTNKETYMSKITPNHKYIFSGELNSPYLRMWKNDGLDNFVEVTGFSMNMPTDDVDKLDISNDGKWLLVSDRQFPYFHFYKIDYENDKLININPTQYIPTETSRKGWSVAISPKNDCFSVGVDKGTNTLYSYKINDDDTITLLSTPAYGNGQRVLDIAYSKNGSHLATAGVGETGVDDTVITYTVNSDCTLAKNGDLDTTLEGTAYSVDFSFDSAWLAIVNFNPVDGQQKLHLYEWDGGTTFKLKKTIDGQYFRYCTFNNFGKLVATGANGPINLYDQYNDFELAYDFIIPNKPPTGGSGNIVHSATWSLDGTWLIASAYLGPNIYGWKLNYGLDYIALKDTALNNTDDLYTNEYSGGGVASESGVDGDRILVNKLI